jgi:hypothetical protein
MEETERGLHSLHEMRGVILMPGSSTVWSLHLFAFLPTRFRVTAGQGGWWANCAWCSLGIAATLATGVTIRTGDGAEGDELEFSVAGGTSSRPDLPMHFPYPPARWWDNPYCPCGNILLFSSQDKIDGWCARHGRPKGSVLDMATAIGLAQRWFGDYASPEWRRKSPQDASRIFDELGLDRAFWKLP